VVRSVRVCDVSEQNLVPSISMLSNNNHDFSVLVLCTQVNTSPMLCQLSYAVQVCDISVSLQSIYHD
jgi:hypothetical protein